MYNVSFIKSTVERLYTDTVTIKRHMESTSELGRTSLVEETIYTSIPCRISQKNSSLNNQTESSNELSDVASLYLDKDYLIQQGDELYVNRGNQSSHYIAGEPFVYDTHQEIRLIRREYA